MGLRFRGGILGLGLEFLGQLFSHFNFDGLVSEGEFLELVSIEVFDEGFDVDIFKEFLVQMGAPIEVDFEGYFWDFHGGKISQK